MVKLSAIIAALGLALIAASALPWGGAAGTATSTTAGDPAYGRQLFAAKGCAQCHRHATIPESGMFGGMSSAPDLTDRPGDPAYQRAWLQNPQALKPTTQMPNLGLADDEIAALIAFLQMGVRSSR